MRAVLALALCVLGGAAGALGAPTDVVRFSGHEWHVRDGFGGPGPNHFARENVWLDPLGRLHLRLAPCDEGWCGAEVRTRERFHFGDYAFRVVADAPAWDERVVLGLFTYGPLLAGPDGTNEIDVELSRFGDPTRPNGHFVVYPATPGRAAEREFELPLPGVALETGFSWRPDHVAFHLRDALTGGSETWTFAQAERVPQHDAPVHLNLWLFEGRPSERARPVEVVVERVDLPPRAPEP